MCIICVMPPGCRPSDEYLNDMILGNKDGHGFAIRLDDRIKVFKSARNARLARDAFNEYWESNPDTWRIWHSRIATHGQCVHENSHPFLIPGKPWVMAHNGVIQLTDPPRPGVTSSIQRSDSRIVAEEYLPNWSWDELVARKGEWERFIHASKMVVMTAEHIEKPVVIFNEESGKWHLDEDGDGCWYSREMGGWWKSGKSYSTSYKNGEYTRSSETYDWRNRTNSTQGSTTVSSPPAPVVNGNNGTRGTTTEIKTPEGTTIITRGELTRGGHYSYGTRADGTWGPTNYWESPAERKTRMDEDELDFWARHHFEDEELDGPQITPEIKETTETNEENVDKVLDDILKGHDVTEITNFDEYIWINPIGWVHLDELPLLAGTFPSPELLMEIETQMRHKTVPPGCCPLGCTAICSFKERFAWCNIDEPIEAVVVGGVPAENEEEKDAREDQGLMLKMTGALPSEGYV